MKKPRVSRSLSVLMALMAGMTLLLASCSRKPMPRKMMPAKEPNEEQAIQNACVTFMAWLKTEAPNLTPDTRQRVYDYAVEALEQALDKKLVDRKMFARIFCNPLFVEAYNTMAEATAQLRALPKEYQTVDRALNGYNINAFFTWCSQGMMVRGNGPEVILMGTPRTFTATEKPQLDTALQNIACLQLRQAQQLGFQPVRGKMTFEWILQYLKTAYEKGDWKKLGEPQTVVKAFCDRQYLECQEAKYAAEQMKLKAQKLNQKDMTTCLNAIGKFCVSLHGELVDKKYLERK